MSPDEVPPALRDVTTYRIEVATAAARQLRTLDPAAPRRIQAAVELLGDEPCPAGAKKLAGGDSEWRARAGDYRIVYEIRGVVAVGHRREGDQRH